MLCPHVVEGGEQKGLHSSFQSFFQTLSPSLREELLWTNYVLKAVPLNTFAIGNSSFNMNFGRDKNTHSQEFLTLIFLSQLFFQITAEPESTGHWGVGLGTAARDTSPTASMVSVLGKPLWLLELIHILG